MRISLAFAAIATVLALAAPAHAQGRPHPTGFGPSDFEANKKFGLGLELGDLVGITGKVFVTPNQAVDFGLGDYGYAYREFGAENRPEGTKIVLRTEWTFPR